MALLRPKLSDEARAEQLSGLSQDIAEKRSDAINARESSGIEKVWMQCEEAYLGIDDANRHEFSGAQWAKPSSMTGPLTRESYAGDDTHSNAVPRLTSRYVDTGVAKLGEILLPIDDKAFSFVPTPDPEMVLMLDSMAPLFHPETGQPVMKGAPNQPGQPALPVQPMPGQPMPPDMAGQGMPPQQQATEADLAQAVNDKATDCAKKAEKRVYDWMVESNYPAEMRKVIHDGGRIGTGVLKGPFPESKTLRAVSRKGNVVALEMVTKIAPVMRWVDTWNLFPHDACGEDVHDGDYIFERDLISAKRLKKLKEQKGYIKAQIDKVLIEGPGKCYVKSQEVDQKSKKRFEIWYFYGCIKRSLLEVTETVGAKGIPEEQEDVDVIISMVNDTIIKVMINPLDSGAFPYRVMTWSRRPGHWAGVGIAEQISTPQRMVTAGTRAVLNNSGVSSGVQLVIDQLGIIPADGQWNITPNKIWYRTGDSLSPSAKDAINAIIIPNIYQALMAVIEYGMKLAEESCGIPLVTQGQTGPSSPETFGQAELQDNNAHTWLRSIGYRFDDMITDPLVRDLYEYLLLDPDIPDDEKGDFEINAHGSIAMVERAIQENTLMGMLNAAANPAFKVDPAKLFAVICKAKRIDPREIQYTKEEQEKMAQQPPPPPLPIAVEQLKGQNAIQEIQAKAQVELSLEQQQMAHEQQMLQSGGTTPHMASATAKIEGEKIRARSNELVEASRAHAEAARADKEYEIAQQNGQFRIEELRLKKEIALLEYTNQQKQSLDDSKTQLAKSVMDNQTKRQLAAAEIELAKSESNQDRMVDIHKHNTSLVRDEISTENTP